ncbi:hypothetical protein [Chryseobacterium shigense]|uniref:Zinc carboxypeptidase n=1 Tax=Chryseobacterium shigense TaxID=297244 RepID=A0A841N0H8_9FLAO|nr:hypothetical protein [Chryseobacterium shigense]MBB6370676.1 hypothetical protein [Chryseobacterium shigense]
MKKIAQITAFFACLYVFAQEIKKHDMSTVMQNFSKTLAEKNVWGKKIILGYNKNEEPIYAYYYNKGGTEADKAMIIAGVHGSEFYGMDVAMALKGELDKLKVNKFKWKVLIVPEVFKDNVQVGRQNIFKLNEGRKSCEECVDPNRQMPVAGQVYNIGDHIGYNNQEIEIENQYLLHATQKFNPSRIASLHCKNGGADWIPDEKIRNLYKQIGIYADPKTDNNSKALGFYDDSILPLRMAVTVKENGGIIFGNFVNENYARTVENSKEKYIFSKVTYLNPIYPQDSAAVEKGLEQYRSYKTKDSEGLSYGTWASTEIMNNGKLIKNAATILTVELPQYYFFFSKKDDVTTLDKEQVNKNTSAYVKALMNIFLENK